MNNEFNNSGTAGDVITQSTLSDKSKVAAAVLCFFLGEFGIHRFYLGQVGSGIVMLVLAIIGWVTVAFLIGYAPLGIVWIWSLIDFIRILSNNMGDSSGRKLR